MSDRGSERTPSRPRWPLLGLLLVALFLGHDGLMASEAASPTRAQTEAAHHAAESQPQGSDASAPHRSAPASGHPENCRIGQTAVSRGTDDTDGTHGALPAADHVVRARARSGSPVGRSTWEEPHWPPGTRRALFQVYLI